MPNRLSVVICVLVLPSSCTTKKEILYLQDIDQRNNAPVLYTESEIQPNDLLSIMVVTVNPETAQPYNLQNNNQGGGQMLQLQGYLVAPMRSP